MLVASTVVPSIRRLVEETRPSPLLLALLYDRPTELPESDRAPSRYWVGGAKCCWPDSSEVGFEIIFTWSVGTGTTLSSNLLGVGRPDFSGVDCLDDRFSLSGVDSSKRSGVDRSNLSGVDRSNRSGVDRSEWLFLDSRSGVDRSDFSDVERFSGVDRSSRSGVDRSDLLGVDRSDLLGVDRSDLLGVDRSNLSGVDRSNLSGVDRSNLSGVGRSNLSGVDRSLPEGSKRSWSGVILKNEPSHFWRPNLLLIYSAFFLTIAF